MAEGDMSVLWKSIKDFLNMKIEYVKLTAVEKLIIILSAVAFLGLVFILGACALFFLSVALVTLIDSYIDCVWASNLIMVGIIAVMILFLCLAKKQLIINPISRFITKLFLNPPQK